MAGVCYHRYLVRAKSKCRYHIVRVRCMFWRGKVDVTGEGRLFLVIVQARFECAYTYVHTRDVSPIARRKKSRGGRAEPRAEQRESFRWPFKARTFRSVTVFRVQRCATPQGETGHLRVGGPFSLSRSLGLSLPSRRLHCFINSCRIS